MKDNTKEFELPVGRPTRRIHVKLCAAGHAKVLAYGAKLQYRSAGGNPWEDRNGVKRNPYVFARYRDRATGKEVRPELGRWLLGSTEFPVTHLNGDLLDFRIENLEERETQRQKMRREGAAAKQADRERRRAERAAKLALRPPTVPDGLTPDEKLIVAFDKTFQRKLRAKAGAIIQDPSRAEEVVSMVIMDCVGRIQRGEVKDIRAYLKAAVRFQALKERDRSWYGEGDVRRPRGQTRSLSQIGRGYKKQHFANLVEDSE